MTYKKLLSKTISVNVSFLLLLQQSVIAGEIITDVNADSSFRAIVEKARNNVPVVNIVKPNEKGLSHNKFSDYNVNKEGVILNNSNQKEVNTQLSGYIYGNKNLAGGNTASTILNEVTSRNKTELKGFTEIAGDKAKIVIANQNGIYINAAGFINTQKATITTGAVNLQNGNIENYRVDKGEIQIDEEGLNTTNVDKTELYSKVVKLNAKIHSKDIDIVTGKNSILSDGSINKIDEVDESKPEVSLDSSSLGGIYANKITLIGTQDGVGINLPIEINAQDDLKISADGKINLDKVVSNKNVEIKSTSNNVNSNVIYANSVNVEAKNEINNKDIIASKTDISLKATKIVNENLIASGVNEDLSDSVKGKLNISSERLENKKTLYSKDNLTINSKNIKNTNGMIVSKEDLNIYSQENGTFYNEKGVLQSDKDLVLDIFNFQGKESNIQANNIMIKANDINAKSSNILARNGDLGLKVNNLELNKTLINASNDINLSANMNIKAQDVNIKGNKIDIASNNLILSNENRDNQDYSSKLISNTTIDINVNSLKNVNGYIGANKDINIVSKDIDNSNGVIVTNENLNINSQEKGMFNNVKGILKVGKRLLLDISNFQGDESTIQAQEIEINANDVNAKSSNIVATNGDLKLNTNNLNLSGDNLSKGLLYSTNDILINSKNFISNYLNVQANNNIDINSLDITLNNSIIQSVVDINIQASVFNTNNSTYSSLRNLSLQTNSIKDKNQNIIFTNSIFNSGNSMNITVDDDVVLDSSNKFEAINSITLNSKSLTNNAQFISNDNITINTSDYIINNALLSSGNTITLNANNYITNNDSNNELFGIRGAFTNLNTNLLTNYGLISSLYEMNIKANDIVNYGGIASGNSNNNSSLMNITANNLSNYNTIYSNEDINLFIKDNILNQNATIYATNNITIQGNENKTLRTNSIVNKSAVIQTNYGDINIFGNDILNGRSQEFDSLYESVVRTDKFRSSDGSYHIPESIRHRIRFLGHNDKKHHDEYYDVYYPEYNLIIHMGLVYNQFNAQGIDVNINGILKEDEITSKQSYIFSGKDLTLDTNKLTNEISNISSIGNIRFENSSMILENHELNFTAQLDFTTLLTEGDAYSKFNYLNTGEYIGKSNIYNPFFSYSYQNEIVNSVIQSGEFIYGNINKLENGVIENQIPIYSIYNPTTNTDINNSNLSTSIKSTQNQTVLSNKATVESIQNEKLNPIQNQDLNTNIENNNYELPTNKYGMFTTVDPNKNLNYLVESNPLYTNLSNFTGSQYFLDKMNYQGDRITKRLGDAAYETKLISDSIVKQTGQRFISDNYTSENAQFVALMNNAVNQSGILSLEIGQALTQTQLANLSEDIVWMEEKIVNNQKVLVPVVYLVKDYEYLKGANIIAQKSIDLDVKSSVVNSGNIKSKDYLNLNSKSITNNQGIILSNGKVRLISDEDFLNKNGGIIKASDVQIVSINGNIINQTFFQQNSVNQGVNNFTYTQIGKQSQIEATNGNLVLQANNNIENVGSNLSASKTLSLNAMNADVNLKTIELKNGHNVYFKGGFDKALDIEYLPSTASSGEDVIIKAGNNINLEASKLNAINQINLNAANDVNITAVNDIHYKDIQTTSKGFLSKKTQRDMSYKEEVNSSELNAKDIYITSENDVNLEATKLKAQDNIIVFAKEADVNVLAKEYKEGELHQTSKSSFGGLSKSLDIKSNDALKLNSALLETQAANVVLTSGKDINILASEINSGNLLLANANNNLNILSDEEILKQEEIHKKTSFSPSISGKMLVYAQEKITSDKNSTIKQVSSNLSGNEVILQAQNEMNIIGSNVVADDVILKANDINLLSATQSASNEHSESTKKIGVEVTLNTKEASIFAGGITNKDEINNGNTTQLVSNILGDNVTLISKDSTNVLASNILANNDLIIAGGKNINILSGEATDYKDEIHTYLKAGVSLGVKQNVTDGAKNIVNSAQSIAKSDNAANAGFGTLKLIDTISSTLSSPVSVGLNAIAIVNKNTSSTTNQTVQSSNIYSGNDAIFDAKEDINIKGSSVYVKNDLDIYAKNLNIEAASEKSNSKTTDKNMDLSVGLYGTNAGKVDLSVSQAKQISQSINYVNSNIQAKNLNLNIDNNAKFEGANIQAKDINATVGNNLTLASLQNSSSSKGNSKNLSLSTSQSIGVGTGKNKSQRDWVDNQTTFIGTNSMKVNAEGTTTIKGAVLANADYVNGKLVDKNNLKLNTTNLITQNIYDKNDSNSYNLSLGVDNSEKQTQGKMELGLSDSLKEQISYATIGNGNIEVKDKTDISNVNRDVKQSQVVAKDENNNLNIYLSNTSINKALNPNQTVVKWKQDFKDMGLNVRNEIIGNLPSATKLDKDGNGNIFDKTIGKALDYNPYGIGIVPSVANGGGYITQIATQLSGDNRGIIQTTNKQTLLNMNISDKDIISTEDGNYVTNPNKTIVILKDKEAIENEKKLSDYNDRKIYITQEDAKSISHMFTNGIMNESQEAFSNGNEQTGYANTMLVNYNQTHGAIGDLMESLQDSVVVKGIALTNYIGASSVNPYLSYLGTGSAKQTAQSLIQLAQARDGKLVVDAHSQGTLLTYAAMQYVKEDLQNVLKDKKDTTLKVGFYGSPVNSAYSSVLVKDLYTGSNVKEKDLNVLENYFRSSINPGDPVGSISILLGGNGAGINSSSKSEGESSYIWSSRGIGSMFNGKSPDDLANSSPHSGYVCVIGCGDGMVTPDTKYYINSDAKEIKLENFYEERNLNKDFATYPQGGK